MSILGSVGVLLKPILVRATAQFVLAIEGFNELSLAKASDFERASSFHVRRKFVLCSGGSDRCNRGMRHQ